MAGHYNPHLDAYEVRIQPVVVVGGGGLRGCWMWVSFGGGVGGCASLFRHGVRAI